MADNNKVVFRRGEESELPAQGSIQPGAFYVVTDKKRFLYGQDENNFIEFGSMPFEFGPDEPDDKRVFWIDTTPYTGGLRYYDGTGWPHVPVAFTAKNPSSTNDGSISAEQPAEDAFSIYGTYNENIDWKAPYDGWFKIEVYGASGSGGTSDYPIQWTDPGEDYDDDGEPDETGTTYYSVAGGGSGGNGGYSCSIVKLKKDNIVNIIIGNTGAQTIVKINSDLDEYNVIIINSGGDGGHSVDPRNGTINWIIGAGGVGGTVESQGNIRSINGTNGSKGNVNDYSSYKYTVPPAISSTTIEKGKVGGSGSGWSNWNGIRPNSGESGSVRISVANTSGN